MKKFLIIFLAVVTALMVACSNGNDQTSTKATENTSQQSKVIYQDGEKEAKEFSDEMVLKAISEMECKFIGYTHYLSFDGEVEVSTYRPPYFIGKFEEPKLIKKYQREGIDGVLYVDFEAGVDNISYHSEERQEFSLQLNTEDNLSLISEEDEKIEVIIKRNVEFKPEFILDQNKEVYIRVDEELYNANKALFDKDSVKVEDLGIYRYYDIYYVLNYDTVKDMEVLKENYSDKLKESISEAFVEIKVTLNSGLVLHERTDLDYFLQAEREKNNLALRETTKDYEYWWLEDHEWGLDREFKKGLAR